MMLPTVHLNGTSRASLIEQYHEAYMKLQEALVALRKLDVNARDYYPQGPDAYRQANLEHCDRMLAVEKVQKDIGAIWESLLP